jgi:hypothetical protein
VSKARYRAVALISPAFIDAEGFVTNDAKRLNARMARHVGVPPDLKTRITQGRSLRPCVI